MTRTRRGGNPSHPWRRARMAAFALALSACGGGGPGTEPSASVRDSAGVRIVENRGTLSEARLGWRVADRAEMRIGGDAPGAELYQVTSATRLGDGRIVAANAGTNQVRIYAPDGRLLRSAGRAGSGPGEFGALLWVGRLPGDSIAAWDAALARLSVFTPAGDFARVVTPRGSLGMFPQARGVLADGRVVVAAGSGQAGSVTPEPRVRRDTAAFVVLGRLGEVSDTLGRFPGSEMLWMAPPSGLLVRPLPFGRQTVAAVQDGRVLVGTGDRYELAAYEPGRGLRTLVRALREPVPVTPADVEAYRKTVVTLGAEGDATFQRQQRLMLERAPYPRTMPAYTDLKTDGEGNLWVEEPRTPGDGRGALWTVFSREGRARGTVRMPPGLTVHEIGTDWVLGVAMDADQVEHLRLHRLQK